MSGALGIGIVILIAVPKAGVILLVVLAVRAATGSARGLYFGMLTRSLPVVLLVFAGWSVCSALIAGQLAYEAIPLVKLVGLLAAGVLVVTHFMTPAFAERVSGIRAGTIVSGVASGAILLAGMAAYTMITGEAPWGSFYSDPLTTLNNNAVVLSLMLWPLVGAQLRGHRVAGVFAFVGAAIVIAFLPSSAALVALLVGCSVVLLRRLAGRHFGIGFAAIVAVSFAAAPYIISQLGADKFMAQDVVNDSTSDIPYSARHRLAMWAFAAEKIDEKPLLGWGFNASRHIPQEEYRLAPNMEIMPLHPHNLSLQTRLELGVPGVLILASLVFAVFYRLATFTDDGWKSGVAMAAATGWLFVANVSYGMWQSWWIALAFLLAILMKIALAECPRTPN